MLPPEADCPKCKEELSLEENERRLKRFRCPSCLAFIEYSGKEPRIIVPEDYVNLITKTNPGDIALIRSVFDSEEIDYYISGDTFLTWVPIIKWSKVFVIKSDCDRAQELLEDTYPEIIENGQETS